MSFSNNKNYNNAVSSAQILKKPISPTFLQKKKKQKKKSTKTNSISNTVNEVSVSPRPNGAEKTVHSLESVKQ